MISRYITVQLSGPFCCRTSYVDTWRSSHFYWSFCTQDAVLLVARRCYSYLNRRAEFFLHRWIFIECSSKKYVTPKLKRESTFVEFASKAQVLAKKKSPIKRSWNMKCVAVINAREFTSEDELYFADTLSVTSWRMRNWHFNGCDAIIAIARCSRGFWRNRAETSRPRGRHICSKPRRSFGRQEWCVFE